MLTSTPFGFAPVQQIEGRMYPVPGPCFSRLAETWTRELGFDPHADFRRPTAEA